MFFKGNTKACINLGKERENPLIDLLCSSVNTSLSV